MGPIGKSGVWLTPPATSSAGRLRLELAIERLTWEVRVLEADGEAASGAGKDSFPARRTPLTLPHAKVGRVARCLMPESLHRVCLQERKGEGDLVYQLSPS